MFCHNRGVKPIIEGKMGTINVYMYLRFVVILYIYISRMSVINVFVMYDAVKWELLYTFLLLLRWKSCVMAYCFESGLLVFAFLFIVVVFFYFIVL